MKNITDELLRWRGRFPKEVFRLITLFLGGDKTEGDCIHGLTCTDASGEYSGWSAMRDRLQEAVDSGEIEEEDDEDEPDQDWRQAFHEGLKECVSLADEHDLIEVTGIDNEGDFVYALTDKGEKLSKRITLPEGATEVEFAIIRGRDDWIIPILKDMGAFEQPEQP